MVTKSEANAWLAAGPYGPAPAPLSPKEAATRITEQAAEIERLCELVEAGRRAIGDHCAPNDCYATGPLTGNAAWADLVECPACSFLAKYERAQTARAALAKGGSDE